MAANGEDLRGPLLRIRDDDGTVWREWGDDPPPRGRRRSGRPWTALAIAAALLALAGVVLLLSSSSGDHEAANRRHGPGVSTSGPAGAAPRRQSSPHEVESGVGAAAADDARCSEVGSAALRAGGHAVDAAVAAALCLGVVHPMSSGLGGGAFVVVRDAASGEAVAFDARETAPAAATPDMYAADPTAKYRGAMAMGVPGELAGLHAAWTRYGRLPWRDLVAPAIRLARDGYEIVVYVAGALRESEDAVLADPGLRAVFAPAGKVLAAGETCRNPALAATLERVAEEGAAALYGGGAVGEDLVRDVRAAGGILTVDDLRGYKLEVSEAMRADAMGYTFLGMPPPSSGTVGMTLILNILRGYKSLEFLKGFLGIHRIIESIKHMLAIRMDLGDPDFVNVTGDVAAMLSTPFADKVRRRIVDNTTFPPGYYFPKWRQLDDHGTSHLCVVDGDRNAVAMTTTVNYYFGAKVLSPSTGIVLNNEMDDFSVPAKLTPDHLPPAPANFIAPGKRPLSSMTPLIILKALVSNSQRLQILQQLFADIALKVDDRARDAIMSENDDDIAPVEEREDGWLCFYEILANHFVRVPESGRRILELIVQLWSQSFASNIFALLFHKWLFEAPLGEKEISLRYSSALVQGATNVFWIDVQTNTRHFLSLYRYLLEDVALVPDRLTKISLQAGRDLFLLLSRFMFFYDQDHLLSSFLEHFPTFPNSFLIGGPADYFVIELTDQLQKLKIEPVLLHYLSRMSILQGLELRLSTSTRLKACLYSFTSPGGPTYPTRAVRHAAWNTLDLLFPIGRYPRHVISLFFRLLYPWYWPSSCWNFVMTCAMTVYYYILNLLVSSWEKLRRPSHLRTHGE